MPDASATVVPADTTTVIALGQVASDYLIYGNLEDKGVLSDAEVSQTSSPGEQGALLLVDASGSASDIDVVGAGGQVDVSGTATGLTFGPFASSTDDYSLLVRSGGVVNGVTQIIGPLSTQSSYEPPPYGAGINVAAGGELDNAQMAGFDVTNYVGGTARNLSLNYGANLTVGGTVTGLQVQGYLAIVEYGTLETDSLVTLDHGAFMTGAVLGQGSMMTMNAGSTLIGASLSGGFSGEYDNLTGNSAALLNLATDSSASSIVATGTATVEDAGSVSNVMLEGQSLAIVTGHANNVTVSNSSFSLGSLFADLPFLVYGGVGSGIPPSYLPTGLVVEAGGVVTGVSNDALEVVQAGGSSTGGGDDGTLVVFAGGQVSDAVIRDSGTVLNNGTLLYTGSGTTTDTGNIVTATVNQPFNAGSYTGILPGSPDSLTFGTGTVVQDGSGRLVLAGNNSYTGGTTLERGTLEIASPTGAGAGPITFVPDGQLEVLQLDRAALAGSTFATPVQGFGLGSVVDLAGTAYRPFESAFVSGGHLDVIAPGDRLVASIEVGDSGAPDVTFLALPDLHGGTAVVALPDALLAEVASGVEKVFGASLPTLVADLASTPIGADVVGSILKDLTGQTSVGTIQLASAERSLPSAVQAIVKSIGGPHQILAHLG